jgi:hypothetical protein
MGFTSIPLPCTLALIRGTGVEGHDGMAQEPANVGCIMGSEKSVSSGGTAG